MRFIDLMEEWLKEHKYSYRLVPFSNCHCLVLDNTPHSIILDDRINVGKDIVVMAADPHLFEKLAAALGSARSHMVMRPSSTAIITVCMGCSSLPNHPHPAHFRDVSEGYGQIDAKYCGPLQGIEFYDTRGF